MFNIFQDIFNYFQFKKIEKNTRIGFFSENNFIYEYLEPFIKNKLKKHKIIIISFQKLEKTYLDKSNIFLFKTKIIQELVFLTLKLKYLYSSTPDLNYTIFKKSKFSNCKYIYLSHTPVSMTLIYKANSFNHFNAIQVTNDYQYKEMIEIKEKNNLKIKIFKSKYLFVREQQKKISSKKFKYDVLVAPSWNSNFYKTDCHSILINLLKKKGLSFKFRPHPMSYKKEEISKKNLKDLNVVVDEDRIISFQNYNFIISDWSGIFIEYSLIYKKKAFLINTPKKMVNKNYDIFDNKPIEITLRNILGESYEINEIPKLVDSLCDQKNSQNNSNDENFKQILDENFY